MRKFMAGGSLAAAALLAGCASVSGGNVQKMYLQVAGGDGAQVMGAVCRLSNDKGSWQVVSPGETSVVRSNRPMEIRCEKPPMSPGVVSVASGARTAMLGNLIAGGVIGAVIDHETGSGYEYPVMVRVTMGITSTLEFVRPNAVPPASGYAALSDIDSLPGLGARGREGYQAWLKRNHPRAFAIGPRKNWASAVGRNPSDHNLPSDPVERALGICQRNAGEPCQLYAVNDEVVWPKRQAPAAAAAGGADSPEDSVAPAPAPAGPAAHKAHTRQVPPASGYADPDNLKAVPVRAEGKDRFAHYLTLPSPKAFVVYEDGGWRFWTDSENAMTQLLDRCAREGRKCWLYAVDNTVVWREDVSQRVGRPDQLADR